MFSLFNRQPVTPPVLPKLDESLYPLSLQSQTFSSPDNLLLATIQDMIDEGNKSSAQQEAFSTILQSNDVYQEWINFTVFGRYVQRSFSAFYRQSEDAFNADMPELLRHELMQHTQRLPTDQVLFCGGNIPASVRQEKLIISTLSPYIAIENARSQMLLTQRKHPHKHDTPIVINQISVCSEDVKAFAIKHNKRTSERYRHEVMILDFTSLRLVHEKRVIEGDNPKNIPPVVLRFYDVK